LNYFDKKKARIKRNPDTMDVDAMTTKKRITLMKKWVCFICEEKGHLAREHQDYMKKKKANIRGATTTSNSPGPSNHKT
jgi:hypothetical protein